MSYFVQKIEKGRGDIVRKKKGERRKEKVKMRNVVTR
jgi:hypothetical protein